jgi:hypothetical protein
MSLILLKYFGFVEPKSSAAGGGSDHASKHEHDPERLHDFSDKIMRRSNASAVLV